MKRRGIVHYHRHKPGRQAYYIDAEGITGVLNSPELVEAEVALHDTRQEAVTTTFNEDGIFFLTAPSSAPIGVGDWEHAYEAEISALMASELGAAEVRVFDHTLRVDDPAAERRPARNVHTDYSPRSARERLEAVVGEQADAWAAGHYAFVNLWRPVGGVVRSAPLAFVRPRTVQASDWLTLDLIYPDRKGEILGLVANPEHEWIYRSAMTPDEVVAFNIYDNRGLASVAHSAVDVTAPPDAVRRSVESRLVLRFSD